MIIRQSRTVTYTCPDCGSNHFEDISLFDFSGNSEVVISCRCGKSQLTIKTEDYKRYNVIIPCIGCGEKHEFTISFYEMWIGPVKVIKCENTGIELCLIGKDGDVRKYFDTLEQKKDALANAIGFKKVFSNSTVMLEVFNKIHDIAEKDNLVCECGCKNVSVYMLYDKIILQCARCGGLDIISAKDSFDLKAISQKDQIILYKQIQYI